MFLNELNRLKAIVLNVFQNRDRVITAVKNSAAAKFCKHTKELVLSKVHDAGARVFRTRMQCLDCGCEREDTTPSPAEE